MKFLNLIKKIKSVDIYHKQKQLSIILDDLIPFVLYENETGTLGNVTLSDNAENYDYIEIYYRTTGRSGSIKVEDITNKTLTLPFTITARNTLVILAKAVTISSNIITDGGEFQYMKSTNGESYSELDSIYIYKVLGYKRKVHNTTD